MIIKFILLFILLGTFCHSKGQLAKNKHQIVTTTLAASTLKHSGFQQFEAQPRPFFNLDVYPLSWLSAGVYHSFQQSITAESGSKYKAFGGRLALHAYPFFEWTDLTFFKNHLDFYLAANLQQDNSEYITYIDYDQVTWEKIVLKEPAIFKQSHFYTGFSVGCNYYFIRNLGANFEFARIGPPYSFTDVYKAGIIVRF